MQYAHIKLREALYDDVAVSLPMLANGVEGEDWESIVKKTVVKPEYNSFSDAELAGAILWGATFYGFTRHYKWQPSYLIFSKFGEQAKRIGERQYIPYLRDKKKIRELKNGVKPYGVAFTMEEWDEIYNRHQHQNRSKRKRFHRIEQRIKQLKQLDKRQHLINRLQEAIGFDATPASEILNAVAINEDRFDSHTYGKLPRLDYLIDLLENYSPDFDEICQSGDHNIVVCYTADSTPLSIEEETRLHTSLDKHFPYDSNSQRLFASDNTIPDELALQFIGIKN